MGFLSIILLSSITIFYFNEHSYFMRSLYFHVVESVLVLWDLRDTALRFCDMFYGALREVTRQSA